MRVKSKVVDFDGFVLARMYDYVGHVVRAGARDPEHLPSVILSHRDKEWCRQHQEVMGHQGHAGRFHPWSFERQYYCYFSSCALDWKAVARSKVDWNLHKAAWIKAMFGGRGSSMKYML